jgi:hypothetical protein
MIDEATTYFVCGCPNRACIEHIYMTISEAFDLTDRPDWRNLIIRAYSCKSELPPEYQIIEMQGSYMLCQHKPN